MKRIRKTFYKYRTKLEATMIALYVNVLNLDTVFAAPSPNVEAAKKLVNPWINAGIAIVQWGAVGLGIIYVGRVGLSYLQATEEERQRMPIWSSIKRGIMIVIIVESIVEIFKAFGLNQ